MPELFAPRSPSRRLRHAVLAVLAGLAALTLAAASGAAPAASPVVATEAAPAAANPQLEARMMALAAELRCLVCQNQTIADSHAGLAEDLRAQIREQLAQGRSEREILDFMTERYGDFVLYRPPFKASTALLWLGPAALLLLAVGALIRVLRRRQNLPAEAFDPDSGEEVAEDVAER